MSTVGSTVSPGKVNELLKHAGFEMISDGLKALWKPDEAALAKCAAFGEELARAL